MTFSDAHTEAKARRARAETAKAHVERLTRGYRPEIRLLPI
jgi:hypothetical protein